MIVTTNIDMNLKTLFKKIKARMDVEDVFYNLKNEYKLKHCYVHGDNSVEAILYLIFIVNNFTKLFLIWRLRNIYQTQREMVKVLLKGLYLLKYRAEIVFDTS